MCEQIHTLQQIHSLLSDIAKCSLKYQLSCQKHKMRCQINREECARRRKEDKKEQLWEVEMTGPVFHIRALVSLQFVNTMCLVNIRPDTGYTKFCAQHAQSAFVFYIDMKKKTIISLYSIN